MIFFKMIMIFLLGFLSAGLCTLFIKFICKINKRDDIDDLLR